eukprot:m.545921 g.545921  ORF g.545921 m.545921 type:complete len:55 (+) comp22148_c2_seq5:539-703(+)
MCIACSSEYGVKMKTSLCPHFNMVVSMSAQSMRLQKVRMQETALSMDKFLTAKY